jgi:hypothetical protein
VSNIRTGSPRREPARAGKLAKGSVAKANIETTERRDIIVDLRISLVKVGYEAWGSPITASYG